MKARTYHLDRIQFIPRPRAQVFAFFSEPTNLERITPEFLRFRILTPRPIPMAPGTLIDYELRLWGVPVRWRTRIESFEPESRFTDVQLRGPYRSWHHTHEFAEVPGGTRVRDSVVYQLPLGPMGRLAHALLVRRSLGRIFDHRRDAVAAILGP